MRHRRVSLSVPGARDYVTFPGYVFGPAGHGSVVRSVMHTCVAVICDAVRRSHKDVELTHLRLAASLPCPEGANHHTQPSGRLLVNVGCETQGVSFEKAWEEGGTDGGPHGTPTSVEEGSRVRTPVSA